MGWCPSKPHKSLVETGLMPYKTGGDAEREREVPGRAALSVLDLSSIALFYKGCRLL